MCGRYTVVTKVEAIEKEFNAQFNLPFTGVYNAAPSHSLPVITNESPNVVQLFRWGLIPFWAKDEKIAYKTINARSEDVISKPSFRKPIRSQRCLVLANCYFEWKRVEEEKVPHVIYIQDQRIFAMAGIWDQWISKESGELIESFSILTLPATPRLNPLHHRMPIILPKSRRHRWLSNSLPLSEVTALFNQYPQERMNAYPVSSLVNSPINNTAEIVQPIGPRIAPEVVGYKANTTTKLEPKGPHRKL